MPRASDNEIFITLVSAADRDPELAGRVPAITRLPEIQRKIKVLQLVNDCREEGAPVDFIGALTYLGENAIAYKVSEFLGGQVHRSV